MNESPNMIGFLLFPEVEELDFVGPYEVLGNASDEEGKPYCQVTTVGTDREITCRRCLRVISDHLLENAPDMDLLIVPGGPGARKNYDDEEIVTFLRQQHKQTPVIASVCTGAFYLAYSGFLDGGRATTHPSQFDSFRKLFPKIELMEQKIVDEGAVVTAGGVSSGIDLGLYFIEQWFGSEARAREIKRLDGPWK